MESGMYFAAFVLGISAVHLVWKAVAFFNKKSNSVGLYRTSEKKQNTGRSDWYMFFHLSDLTGAGKAEDSKTDAAVSDRTAPAKNTRKRRRSGSRIHL